VSVSDVEPAITTLEAGGRFGPAALVRAWPLIVELARRDLALRFRRLVPGLAWSLLQPVLPALVCALAASGTRSDRTSGLLFYLAGFVVWLPAAATILQTALAIERHAATVPRVGCHRAVFPVAAALGGALDHALALAVYVVASAALGRFTPWLLPGLLLAPAIGLLAALGLGLVLAALQPQFRELRHALPYLIQLGVLCSPVVYAPQAISGWAERALQANPLAAAIELLRCPIEGRAVPLGAACLALLGSGALVLVGLRFFEHREPRWLDRL